MPRIPSLTLRVGQQFGRLTITSLLGTFSSCTCACGGSATVRNDRLRSGKTQSCGCLLVERNAAAKKPVPPPTPRRSKPSRNEQKLRAVYWAMMGRCHNPNNKDYARYGARGIEVCLSWRGSIDAFLQDMMPTYRPGLWLEREDNDLGYSPDNCVFRTPFNQSCNRRNTLTFPNGVALPTWCRHHSVDYQRAYRNFCRLRGVLGRTPNQAELTTALQGIE